MDEKPISFSECLLNKGLITKEQLEKVHAIQNKKRLLGTIAIELGIISPDDALKVHEYQETHGAPFGEAAISLGFITSSQLKFLLDVRTRKKVRSGDILVREGFMEKEKLYVELMQFEKKRHRLEKILVCDSSEFVNSLLKMRLEKYGYQILTGGDPAKAMKTSAQERPNLLIISNDFEDFSGLNACSKLLSMPDMEGLKIILMAEKIDKKLMEKAFEAGVHHFLQKPVMEYELLNVIYSIEQKEKEMRREKILVVEDSDIIRQIMVRELKQHGYTVFQAGTGEDALNLIKKKKPDLITMDIILPGMDGYETCRRLRNEPSTQDIPVVIVTKCNSLEERMKGFEAGAVEYFIKPFAPNQLANYINVLFEAKKARRKEKAVVIEDNKTTLHIIKHILEKQGIQVITAGDGKEGLEKIRQTMPDIILSDIYMPEMDGFEVLRQIRKSAETKRIPLVLLTSSREREDVLRGLAQGANDYLVKPFDEEELLGRAMNLLASKRLYDELKEAHDELEAMNQNLKGKNSDLEILHKEKESFYSILTHDLRAPIMSVLGFARLLGEDPGKFAGEEESYLKTIISSSERQLGIIEDSMEIFRFETRKDLKIKKGDLGGVIVDVLSAHFPSIKARGIELTVNGNPFSAKDSYPLSCSFHRMKITRVVENLFTNAAKYAQKRIDVSLEAREGFVEVRVKDDGKGIPEKYVDRIFEDFFQVPGSEKGTGLGLVSAKRIVEAHGGKIWVDPSPGRCAFHFTLPL